MKFDRQLQDMFWLGFTSNCGTTCTGRGGDLDTCVYNHIASIHSADGPEGKGRRFFKDTDRTQWDMVNLADNWTIVWLGVGLKERFLDADDGPHPTNVVYVAKQTNPPASTYFVSVAGTDSKSFFDTLEDFQAHVLLPWPHLKDKPTHTGLDWPEDTPLISFGFHKGLELIEEMTSYAGPTGELPGAGKSLTAFFNDVVEDEGPVKIITGGHSQGGALSPLVALWLADTQTSWDPDGLASISCWPFAGPTPGNKKFADYYDDNVPNTTSVVNPRDVAVRFFNEDDLHKLKTLYEVEGEADIHPGPRIRHLADALIIDTKGKGYTRFPQEPYSEQHKVVELETVVDITQYLPPPDQPQPTDPPPTDCWKYTMQAGYQHIKAYFEAVGVDFYDYYPDGSQGKAFCEINQLTGLCKGAVD
jgi:hypothetical protein